MFIKNRFGIEFEVSEDLGKQMVRRGEATEITKKEEKTEEKSEETAKPKKK